MPDGLEKTALMTQTLGKSGAELGDVLGAAANGGIGAFQTEAAKLGLAFSDEKTQQTIDYGKAQEKLQATFLGLKTSLGSALIPVLTLFSDTISKLLSDPAIMANIQNFGNLIAGLATKAIQSIPVVISWFQNAVTFLQNNQGIVVAILAAIGVAVLAFGVSVATAAWTALSPLLPVIAVMALVAGAAYLLWLAWDKNFLGIKDTVLKIWNNYLKPAFNTLKEWLEKNIPVAINFLTDIWKNKLLPVLTKVWDFLKTYVFPLFQAIGDFIGAEFSLVWTALSGLWQNVLFPALKKIYEYLAANVFPIFQKIGDWISSKLSPAFSGLGNLLKTVTDWFKKLADSMRNIQGSLPSWLTPHSPFKLTWAFVGLADSIKEVALNAMPDLNSQFSITGNMPVTKNNMSTNSGNGESKNSQNNSITLSDETIRKMAKYNYLEFTKNNG
jgi:hypothetical protein